MIKRLKYLFAKAEKILLNRPAIKSSMIHKTAKICSGSQINYTKVGRYSYLGHNCFSVEAEIGAFCSIADGCRIGGASHAIAFVSTSPVFEKGRNVLKKNFSEHESVPTKKTIIENDVWLGACVQIKSGVTIGTGAVIGAGSIVTHNVPAYEIWAGNPARKIRDRFDKQTAERLLNSEWWTWKDDKIKEYATLFCSPNGFLEKLEKEREKGE